MDINNDYIRFREGSGRVYLYFRSFCCVCGRDKGYARKSRKNTRCKSCASSRIKSQVECEKIRTGVKNFYSKKHKNKPILNKNIQKPKYPYKKPTNYQRLKQGYMATDRKRGFINSSYNLSENEFNEMVSCGCIYCSSTESVGLDRIKNNKGHCKNNVISCCYLCNMTRGDRYTFEEFLIIGKAIKKIIKKRKEGG